MRRDTQRGITIVEVIIALFVASLVIAGAYGILIVQQRVFRRQIQIEGAQEGMSTGIELIQRDLKKAGMGFGICPITETGTATITNWGALMSWSTADTSAYYIRAIDIQDGGNTGPDKISITYGQPTGNGAADATVSALQGTNHLWGTDFSSSPLVQYSTQFAYGTVCPFAFPPTTFAPCTSSTCTGWTFPGASVGSGTNPYPMTIFKYATCSTTYPCCSLFQTTAVACTFPQMISVQKNAATPWNRASGTVTSPAMPDLGSGDPLLILAQDPTASFFRITYSIGGTTAIPQLLRDVSHQRCSTSVACPTGWTCDTTSASTDPTSYHWCSNPQVIANGIEDLQVAAACDWRSPAAENTPDGLIQAEGTPSKAKDEWFYNVAGESDTPATTKCLTYSQVRVSLVSRSSSADPSFTGPGRPSVENRAAGTADGYRRRTMATTVMPPNLNLTH